MEIISLYEKMFEILDDGGIQNLTDLKELEVNEDKSLEVRTLKRTTQGLKDFLRNSPDLLQKAKRPLSKRVKRGEKEANKYQSVLYLSSSKYPWVKELYQENERIYQKAWEMFTQKTDPHIVFPSAYGYYLGHKWDIDDPLFDARSKYSCLFPRHMMYLSLYSIHWVDIDEYWVPVDFLSQSITLKYFLKNELAYLVSSPFKDIHSDLVYGDFGGLDELSNSRKATELTKEFDSQDFLPAKTQEPQTPITLESDGRGLKELKQLKSNQLSSIESSKDIIQVPWLQGARNEDYVELINENPDEFSAYCSLLNKTLNNPDADKRQIKDWFREADHKVKKLDVIYKNKKENLKPKGIYTVLSTMATIGSVIFGTPTITALLGGRTLIDGLELLTDYKQLEQTMSSNDFWLLWELKKQG